MCVGHALDFSFTLFQQICWYLAVVLQMFNYLLSYFFSLHELTQFLNITYYFPFFFFFFQIMQELRWWIFMQTGKRNMSNKSSTFGHSGYSWKPVTFTRLCWMYSSSGENILMPIILSNRCRFSQMLHPIFEEASNIVREEFPNTQQVVFARVDCDQHCEYHCLTEEE